MGKNDERVGFRGWNYYSIWFMIILFFVNSVSRIANFDSDLPTWLWWGRALSPLAVAGCAWGMLKLRHWCVYGFALSFFAFMFFDLFREILPADWQSELGYILGCMVLFLFAGSVMFAWQLAKPVWAYMR